MDHDIQDWVRHVNYLGAAVGGAKRLVSLDPDELMAQASDSTGLTDFGGSEWEDPYRRLMRSLEKDVALHTLGRLMTRSDILRSLRNRLLVIDAHKQEPAIKNETISAPLLVAGQGRTGSSILFELLALDRNNRAPMGWEAASPVEPPKDTLTEGIRRAQIAEIENEFWNDVEPAMQAAHEHRWDLPAECIRFMASDFNADWWSFLYFPTSWLQWRFENPSDSAYHWHTKVLQLLQYGVADKRRWLLKSPAHIRFLDVLVARYPGIRIIHTHRDPVKTIPSTISLSAMVQRSRANNVDELMLAQMVQGGYAAALQKVMDERANGVIPKNQIVDLHFQDLMQDPAAAVEGAYAALDLPFSAEFADAMRDYLVKKPRNQFGKHSYRAEDYGLTNTGIREAYSFYTDHYGVALEA